MGSLQKVRDVGIYTITNMVSGKVYVGSSICLDWRLYLHRRALRKGSHFNRHLQNSWNKNGEDNFDFKIVDRCEEGERFVRELEWIKKFNAMSPNSGFNMRDPDSLKMSQQTRLRMADANFGKPHTRVSSPRKHTKKSLALMSKKQTGENNGMCKVSDYDVEVIKQRISRGDKYAKIAADYGLSSGYITFLRYGWSRKRKTPQGYKTLGPVVRQNKIALTGVYIAHLPTPVSKCQGM